MYSIVVNSTGGYKLGNTRVGKFNCGIISGHVIQFQCSVAYSAPVECKTGNNTGIIGNFERIIGSFWGNKRIE